MKNKEEKGFHFVYVTDEDLKREIEKRILELTEDQKSDFVFENHHLYELGRGYDFIYGFYNEYLTKNGIQARQYLSGLWRINNEFYKYKDSNFVLEPKSIDEKPMDFSKVVFPVIKSISAKTLSGDIIDVSPRFI